MAEVRKFVLWQCRNGTWTRATGPVPLAEAERMQLAAMASTKPEQAQYRVLPENETP